MVNKRVWVKSIPQEFFLDGTPQKTVSLDLGCGRFPRNPLKANTLIGCDVLDNPLFTEEPNLRYIKVFPSQPLPIDSNSVNCVTAYDFLEHIPRFDRKSDGTAINPFIEIMNEIHRVLIDGGVFIAVTPCFPAAAAFGDPTHQNIISEGTHEYFSGHTFAKSHGYGFNGSFRKIEVKRIPLDGILWTLNNPRVAGDSKNLRIKVIYTFMKIKNFTGRVARLMTLRSESYIHLLWVFQKIDSQ